MTHQYTLLLGGTVITGSTRRDATAIAWAEDVILAIGSDAEVRGVSRGDSAFWTLSGDFVIPLDRSGDIRWPTDSVLEVGGPASFAVIESDPRQAAPGASAPTQRPIAVVRDGRLILGELPLGSRRDAEASAGG